MFVATRLGLVRAPFSAGKGAARVVAGRSSCGLQNTRRTLAIYSRAHRISPALLYAHHHGFRTSAARAAATEEPLDLDDAPPKRSSKTKKAATPRKRTKSVTTSDDVASKPKRKAAKAAPKKAATKKAAAPKKKAVKKAAPKKTPIRSTIRLPKQISSVWQLFLTKQIDARKAQRASPDEKISVSKMATEVAADYRSLSQQERASLESELEQVKAQYKIDYEEALAALTPEQINKENRVRAAKRKAGKSHKSNLRDPNRPKTPPSAYILFSQEKMGNADWVEDFVAQLSSEERANPQKRLPHLSRNVAAEWRSMTEDQKASYEDRANAARAEYMRAMDAYKSSTS